jgi:hypothetical protein
MLIERLPPELMAVAGSVAFAAGSIMRMSGVVAETAD